MAPNSDPSNGWKALTLHDDVAHPSHPTNRSGAPNGHLVACGLCGREQAADMMLDVRPIAAALRASLDWARHDFICDGCRETPHRDGRITHEQLATALGAPASVVLLARAHDAVHAGHKPKEG